jgi:hypothetical protein
MAHVDDGFDGNLEKALACAPHLGSSEVVET